MLQVRVGDCGWLGAAESCSLTQTRAPFALQPLRLGCGGAWRPRTAACLTLPLQLLQAASLVAGQLPAGLLFDHRAFVAPVLQAVLGAGALSGACGCAARH